MLLGWHIFSSGNLQSSQPADKPHLYEFFSWSSHTCTESQKMGFVSGLLACKWVPWGWIVKKGHSYAFSTSICVLEAQLEEKVGNLLWPVTSPHLTSLYLSLPPNQNAWIPTSNSPGLTKAAPPLCHPPSRESVLLDIQCQSHPKGIEERKKSRCNFREKRGRTDLLDILSTSDGGSGLGREVTLLKQRRKRGESTDASSPR